MWYAVPIVVPDWLAIRTELRDLNKIERGGDPGHISLQVVLRLVQVSYTPT